MAVTEESRYQLHQALDSAVGTAEAVTMMELLPPVGWADVATKGDLEHQEARQALRFEAIDRRFEAIDRRFEDIDRRFEDIDRRFESIERRLDRLEQRMDALEQVLRTQGRQLTIALVGTWITTLLAIVLTRL